VLENRVLRKILGHKGEEVAGDWRRLHNEELHNLYASLNTIRFIKSRRMRLAGHVGRMEAMRNSYKILVGKCEGKRLLGRPRRRWEDDIRMNLRELDREGIDWMHLAQNRHQWRSILKTVINLGVL
jgi:hypothetical protein